MAEAAANPQVTVLLPVRNGSAHLAAALESIFAQTFIDFELLVIDDGSTDRTPEILRAIHDPRLRVVTHPQNLGLVPTLNLGLELARGEFIARQDHDDISLPARLEKQVAFLRAHPECALVGTEAVQTDARGRRMYRLLRPHSAPEIRWYLCFDNAFIHSSIMFRRDIVRQRFGGYAASLHSEDYALWSRMARECETANLPEPLLRYREHGSSVTGAMSAADAAAFDEATAQIRWENLRALLGERARMEDARLFASYRRDFNAAKAQSFLAVFDRLTAEHDPHGLRHIRAVQLAELAYRLLPIDRWSGAALFWRALKAHPALAGALPWARIAALFLLGEKARNIARALGSQRA